MISKCIDLSIVKVQELMHLSNILVWLFIIIFIAQNTIESFSKYVWLEYSCNISFKIYVEFILHFAQILRMINYHWVHVVIVFFFKFFLLLPTAFTFFKLINCIKLIDSTPKKTHQSSPHEVIIWKYVHKKYLKHINEITKLN